MLAAYEALKSSVYSALVTQTRLATRIWMRSNS